MLQRYLNNFKSLIFHIKQSFFLKTHTWKQKNQTTCNGKSKENSSSSIKLFQQRKLIQHRIEHWYLQVNTLEAFVSEVLFETQDKYTYKIHPANSVQCYLSSGEEMQYYHNPTLHKHTTSPSFVADFSLRSTNNIDMVNFPKHNK